MKTKSQKITAKDYVKVVEWSEEDQCFIGSAPPLIGQCCHGPNEGKVYEELGVIVNEWIAIYEQDERPLPEPSAGKEYSGKFVLRIKPELHKILALRAMQENESLNSYLGKVLTVQTETKRRKKAAR